MKSNNTLSIDAKKAQMGQKYIGDPESPNFMPPSPLIDRQTISPELERELKTFCIVALAKEQSSDDDLAVVARCLTDKPRKDHKMQKHDKHASFTFQPSKPFVPELAASSFLRSTSQVPPQTHLQQRQVRQDGTVAMECGPLQSANKNPSRQNSVPPRTANDALTEIRHKLDARPKTSAAACIDYTEPVSPVHSDRTNSLPSNRTTYSTPFTSAGITPGHTSKRFSENVVNAAPSQEAQIDGTTALPKFPDDVATPDPWQVGQARMWISEQLARRRGQPLTHSPRDPSASKTFTELYPAPRTRNNAEAVHSSRPISRAGSIRNSIREYIRPGSSSASIHTSRSNVSGRSRALQRLSVLKNKVSSTSLRSWASSRRRPGYDDGDEYFINPEEVNLDRPLPPLPGLDSYKEKPKHIGLLMKSIISPSAAKRNTKNVVIDHCGVERVMSADEQKRRQEDLARAVLEKMSMGSIGSVPTSPTGVVTIYRQGVKVSIDGSLSRPVTAGSGMGVGAVPLAAACRGSPQILEEEVVSTYSHAPSPRAPVGGFVRRWGGRLGWGRKAKVVAII